MHQPFDYAIVHLNVWQTRVDSCNNQLCRVDSGYTGCSARTSRQLHQRFSANLYYRH